jgi:hypothetical protein
LALRIRREFIIGRYFFGPYSGIRAFSRQQLRLQFMDTIFEKFLRLIEKVVLDNPLEGECDQCLTLNPQCSIVVFRVVCLR